MLLRQKTIKKIKELPDNLLPELIDFLDFLLYKYHKESHYLAESDMADYLKNLENYETELMQKTNAKRT